MQSAKTSFIRFIYFHIAAYVINYLSVIITVQGAAVPLPPIVSSFLSDRFRITATYDDYEYHEKEDSHRLNIQAFPVFDEEELDLHKYAAIIAASDPLRNMRDQELREAINPLSLFLARLKGSSYSDPSGSLRRNNKKADLAFDAYESRVREVINSYGLGIDSFNAISKQVSTDKTLRKQVMLQAFYYKIAADLESNIGDSHRSMIIMPPAPANTETHPSDSNYVEKERSRAFHRGPEKPNKEKLVKMDLPESPDLNIFRDSREVQQSKSEKALDSGITLGRAARPSVTLPAPATPDHSSNLKVKHQSTLSSNPILPDSTATNSKCKHSTQSVYPPDYTKVCIRAPKVPELAKLIGPEQYQNGRTDIAKLCHALRDIEKERLRILSELKKSLGVTKLPLDLANPEILPAMSPSIQSAVSIFPKTSALILKHHGLSLDEFVSLRKKTERNPIFRFRVSRELKRIEGATDTDKPKNI